MYNYVCKDTGNFNAAMHAYVTPFNWSNILQCLHISINYNDNKKILQQNHLLFLNIKDTMFFVTGMLIASKNLNLKYDMNSKNLK